MCIADGRSFTSRKRLGGRGQPAGGRGQPTGGRSIPVRPQGEHRRSVGHEVGGLRGGVPATGGCGGQRGTIGGRGHRGRGNAAGGLEHPAGEAQEARWGCGAPHVGHRVTGGCGARTVAEARAGSHRVPARVALGARAPQPFLRPPDRRVGGRRLLARKKRGLRPHSGSGGKTRRRTGVVENARGLWPPLAPGWALEGKGRGKGRKVLARR